MASRAWIQMKRNACHLISFYDYRFSVNYLDNIIISDPILDHSSLGQPHQPYLSTTPTHSPSSTCPANATVDRKIRRHPTHRAGLRPAHPRVCRWRENPCTHRASPHLSHMFWKLRWALQMCSVTSSIWTPWPGSRSTERHVLGRVQRHSAHRHRTLRER
jgi:hypothetical protein